ncbi:MAG: hypothetical protein ACM3NF_00660 [Gemmatimonadota bacterium]
MRRALPVLGTLVVALAALGAATAMLGGCRSRASRDASFRRPAEGPTLVLQGVDFTEIRPGGARIRLRSDRASYAILARHLSAGEVTVTLPEPDGEIVVQAPLASWDMDAGVVLLPRGGHGAGAGGWSVSVPEARLDLAAREMTAGDASVSGPGVAARGRDLVWRWKDGTLALDAASGRVLPAKAARRRG